jgi:hypothetical protein
MANLRRKLSPPEEISLMTQVQRVCPLCSSPIFYTKNDGRTQKGYEIAHIYPLNPTRDEIKLLASEEQLAIDPNHIDNLIPLCRQCHGKFDKPRTIEEYRELLKIKKAFIRREQLQELQSNYPLEDEIEKLFNALYVIDSEDSEQELSYNPKKLDAKLDDSMTRPTARIIRHHVTDYFPYIRKKLIEVDSESPNATDLISSQIRSYYLSQKTLSQTQQEIFSNIVDWMVAKTGTVSEDAAEIVAAFFIQNCEIFE